MLDRYFNYFRLVAAGVIVSTSHVFMDLRLERRILEQIKCALFLCLCILVVEDVGVLVLVNKKNCF
jgi:hypothetical protein